MKKIFTIVLFSVLLINLVGCAESQVQRNADNVENSNIQSNDTTLPKIGSSMPQPNTDNSSEENKLINEAEFEGQLPIVDEFILLLHATVGNCFVTEECADAHGLMLQMSHERMDFMLDVFNGVWQIS